MHVSTIVHARSSHIESRSWHKKKISNFLCGNLEEPFQVRIWFQSSDYKWNAPSSVWGWIVILRDPLLFAGLVAGLSPQLRPLHNPLHNYTDFDVRKGEIAIFFPWFWQSGYTNSMPP